MDTTVQDSDMGTNTTVASVFRPLLTVALGDAPAVRFEFWDGSSLTPEGGHSGTVVVNSKDALKNLVWAPGELGLARAYVSGQIDFRGDIFTVLRSLQATAPRDARSPGSCVVRVRR